MRRSPLNDLVPQNSGATFEEYWGWEIVSAYGDPRDEYEAVVRSAAVLDVSYAGKLRISGRDRIRYLNSMLSNDVKGLQPGTGCHAALLTHQGRMESDVFVYVAEDDVRLECSPAGTQRLLETLNRFIVSADVTVEDWTDRLAILSVQGPKAALLGGAHTGLRLDEFGSLAHSRYDRDAFVVCRDRTGYGGFDLWLPPEKAAAVWQGWVGQGHAQPAGHLALDWLRTEAGIPWFGVDVDERRLPMEVGLNSALSYTKGCYRGQEIVARVTYRGHLDRGFGGVALGTADPPDRGCEVRAGDARVGEITSAAFSPMLGSVLALGIFKLEFLRPGQEVEVLSGEAAIPGRVVTLPVSKGPVGRSG
jgi:folate-binding protein YgfZ